MKRDLLQPKDKRLAVRSLTDTAILLAGGKSSRLGRDKKLLSVDGMPLVTLVLEQLHAVFPRVIVVDNSNYRYPAYCQKVGDIITGSSFGGLYSGLSHCGGGYAFVMACDMPFLNVDYVNYMAYQLLDSGKKAAITAYEAWGEPLHAFYHTDLLTEMAEDLLTGEKSMFRFAMASNPVLIPEAVARNFSPDWRMFFNINTQAELAEYYILRDLMGSQAN